MSELGRIFIFSTDERTLTSVATSLASAGGRVIRCSRDAEFRYSLQNIATFDAAIIDMSTNPAPLHLLRDVVAYYPGKPLIAIVPSADLNAALHAIRYGATDYLLQPVLAEDAPEAVARALTSNLFPQFRIAQHLGWLRERDLGAVVGSTEEMRKTLQLMGEIARRETHLLISGERGTGKTYFARLLHFLSPRRYQPLFRISCANKTSGDLLLELFGSHDGLLHPAYDATLLLDECHCLPVSVQNRLGNFIEEQSQTLPTTGVRLIGLTTEPLSRAKPGLFGKIASSQIAIPNLAHRIADLEPLCQVLLRQISEELLLPEKILSTEALRLLRSTEFAGNIRELYLILQRAAVLSRGDQIEPQMLQIAGLTSVAAALSVQIGIHSLQLDEAEEVLIGKALNQNSGNVSRSAQSLGISRGTLYNKMRKYGLTYHNGSVWTGN